jgi:hypothetical protein
MDDGAYDRQRCHSPPRSALSSGSPVAPVCLDEARSEVKVGLASNPRFTIKRYRAGAESDNAVYLTQRGRIIEGMRLAGVPEG